jgi:hypothetical protein
MMAKIHVKPGQSVQAAVADANGRIDNYVRSHARSSMTFEQGLDHVVLNGNRIVRPSGVSRSSWDKFWSKVGWKIVDLH